MIDCLVFDIGGTNLRAGRYLFRKNKLVEVINKPTPTIWNTNDKSEIYYNYLITNMEELTKKIFPECSPKVVTIAFPGPITLDGEILRTPTIWGNKFIANSSFVSDLKSVWPNSVVNIINDVSAAGYFLCSKYSQDFCVITVSSGIGSKLFINGKPYTGETGRGGEIGHWVTDNSKDAFKCECGGKGHLGGIASGRGVLAMAKNQAKIYPAIFQKSLIAQRTKGNHAIITNELLVESYLEEDEWTKVVINKSAKELAKAIALIHTTTGVELFIIIGGFGIALGEPYRKILATFAKDFCWDLGQDWNEMIKLGPKNTEMGLLGAGIFSETVRSSIYENN
ncbi:ROK family protein [Daejeonella oryzae]|uniref:ROK family protein n=1 Tax=Daejeonella oryzae TaxID=1122943 RepID=UPI0004286878|nr:ROK family protein [Daejeonella oryzae]